MKLIKASNRIYAMFLRYIYILRGSWARILELIYWPIIQIVIWGFIGRFFVDNIDPSFTGNILAAVLGAVMLWDILFRAQLGVSLSFMEELWSRNLGHLFVSPIRPYEWCLSMMLVSLFRATLGTLPAALLAIPFYGFSLFEIGFPLILFLFNLLIMGWWLGMLITALLMRAGLGAQGLAWALTILISPFSAIYYPVSTLPEWLQPFANAIPSTNIFEALRALVNDGIIDWQLIINASILNVIYMFISATIMIMAFKYARQKGTLLQTND